MTSTILTFPPGTLCIASIMEVSLNGPRKNKQMADNEMLFRKILYLRIGKRKFDLCRKGQ
jgi:hypothetical protein